MADGPAWRPHDDAAPDTSDEIGLAPRMGPMTTMTTEKPTTEKPTTEKPTTEKPMTVASRGVTLRDFVIFQLKLVLDGTKDFFAIWLSVGAIVLDLISGRGDRPRLFYSVVRASERFDRWINLHGALEEMDATETVDGLFGASRAGDDTFVGRIEELVRGGDEPGRRGGEKPGPRGDAGPARRSDDGPTRGSDRGPTRESDGDPTRESDGDPSHRTHDR